MPSDATVARLDTSEGQGVITDLTTLVVVTRSFSGDYMHMWRPHASIAREDETGKSTGRPEMVNDRTADKATQP